MSWTDRIATNQILKLKDEFDIQTAVATGTFIGADTELYAKHFKEVYTMDIKQAYLDIAKMRLMGYTNITFARIDSWEFIELFVESYNMMGDSDIVYFFLDAHFYDPSLLHEDKWVVIKELQALKGFRNCVIVLHDFDCSGLGHLIYGGEHFGWNVVGEHITKVNPDFHYYCNTREFCDIYTPENYLESGLSGDARLEDSIKFANTNDVKRYRGMLYAVPKELNLNKYQLVEYDKARID